MGRPYLLDRDVLPTDLAHNLRCVVPSQASDGDSANRIFAVVFVPDAAVESLHDSEADEPRAEPERVHGSDRRQQQLRLRQQSKLRLPLVRRQASPRQVLRSQYDPLRKYLYIINI